MIRYPLVPNRSQEDSIEIAQLLDPVLRHHGAGLQVIFTGIRKFNIIHFKTILLGKGVHYPNCFRENFFAGRTWSDLDALNAQAADWCAGSSAQRPCPEDPSLRVAEAFAQERVHLIALPDNPYPTDEQVEVRVGKTPYVRFDLNRTPMCAAP